MMDYETGYQNGLEIALIAIGRIKVNPEDADELVSIIKQFINESIKRQEERLEEMERMIKADTSI